jgi:23S rRNA A2030 N6-methylase RlmJ
MTKAMHSAMQEKQKLEEEGRAALWLPHIAEQETKALFTRLTDTNLKHDKGEAS